MMYNLIECPTTMRACLYVSGDKFPRTELCQITALMKNHTTTKEMPHLPHFGPTHPHSTAAPSLLFQKHTLLFFFQAPPPSPSFSSHPSHLLHITLSYPCPIFSLPPCSLQTWDNLHALNFSSHLFLRAGVGGNTGRQRFIKERGKSKMLHEEDRVARGL